MGNGQRCCSVMTSSGVTVVVDARSFSLLKFVTNHEEQDPLFSAHFKTQGAKYQIISCVLGGGFTFLVGPSSWA